MSRAIQLKTYDKIKEIIFLLLKGIDKKEITKEKVIEWGLKHSYVQDLVKDAENKLRETCLKEIREETNETILRLNYLLDECRETGDRRNYIEALKLKSKILGLEKEDKNIIKIPCDKLVKIEFVKKDKEEKTILTN